MLTTAITDNAVGSAFLATAGLHVIMSCAKIYKHIFMTQHSLTLATEHHQTLLSIKTHAADDAADS